MSNTPLTSTAFDVGPILRSDSAYEGGYRVGEDGPLITCDGHSRFGEHGARRFTFSVFTALTGLSLASSQVAPPAAGVATFLSILNPVGSGVNLEILQGWIYHFSATTAEVGFWAWCGANAGVSITQLEAGTTKRPCFVGQDTAKFKAFSGVNLTGGPAHAITRPFPSTMFAATIAATTWGKSYIVDDVDGAIVVPPGGLLTLAPPAAGTSVTCGGGILLAQIPLAEGV